MKTNIVPPSPSVSAAEKLARLEPLTYTVSELAEVLDCSERHIWRMHDAGDLPAAVRLGRLVRWPKTLIAEWLADGCPKRRR